MLSLYAIFHLNLAFSSIEKEMRAEIVRRCYWPLLHLARDLNLPFGIEISGYTLEAVAAIDPSWVTEFSELCAGNCELLGSGYVQLIGPLVPAEVNRQNLLLGSQAYDRFLGVRPRIALVNEQAYSAGLIGHYLEAGYCAIVMEWDNPALNHTHWHPEWRYLPQIAVGQHGEELPVIWNNSICFQKFQRYAHGELDLEEYVELIARHNNGSMRALPLYGNDVEIFNYRPGRFSTEATLSDDEWRRIRSLFEQLSIDGRFTFISPSMLLSLLHEEGAGNRLSLESAESPIPVKKQEKYNITRWSVTGRDDLGINSSCWRIYDSLKRSEKRDPEAWQELCYLWSSDFRTHITDRRWIEYRERLKAAEDRYCDSSISKNMEHEATTREFPVGITVKKTGSILSVDSSRIRVDLNCRRGLAIHELWFKGTAKGKLCGTLAHGYYDDITLGADYYSGHMVFESPGKPKITDLVAVDPDFFWDEPEHAVVIVGKLQTDLGLITKRVLVYPDLSAVELEYELLWEKLPVGSLRLGYVTLMPESFNRESLFFRTHNGGSHHETFYPGNHRINHGEPASFMVSAKHALGMTEGLLEIGDADTCLRISVDSSLTKLIALITFVPLGNTFFFRCTFSGREMDETSVPTTIIEPLKCRVHISCQTRQGIQNENTGY